MVGKQEKLLRLWFFDLPQTQGRKVPPDRGGGKQDHIQEGGGKNPSEKALNKKEGCVRKERRADMKSIGKKKIYKGKKGGQSEIITRCEGGGGE